ncbi:MAG TPA: hypothetical protein VKO45_03570 [Methanomicrobiales archaeon]|nr:hypothetical protein [Methanomicrobiales archaeon]
MIGIEKCIDFLDRQGLQVLKGNELEIHPFTSHGACRRVPAQIRGKNGMDKTIRLLQRL